MISEFETGYLKCEIILSGFSQNPHCQHGPTVLFSRGGRKFFACSAFRNRLLCPFYLEYEGFQQLEHNKLQKSHHKQKRDSNEAMLHALSNPENNQGQAQYFFSENTAELLLQLLKRLKKKNILCIGTPTIHERFRRSSYLLDIDRKYEKSVNDFSRYNMCNHFFFTDNFNYINHLKSAKNLVVICDPPFGARLELLFNTFQLIEKEWKSFQHSGRIDFIFINPYFAEGKILKLDSKFRMSDYRIEYASHKKFKKGEKSPVRFFTTLDLAKIILPLEVYKFCEVCEKYVFSISKHCKFCKSCDSRDGKVYYHCKKCQKCFKETWTHCSTCECCHLQGDCKFNTNSRKRKLP